MPNLPPFEPQQALCSAVLPDKSCIFRFIPGAETNFSTISILPFQQDLLKADLPNLVGISTLQPYSKR